MLVGLGEAVVAENEQPPRPLWYRRRARPVSESGTLCHGDGAQSSGDRRRRVFILPILLAERFSIRPDEVILSTVSYLRPFKNPQILFEACGELAARHVPFRLFVAGDGDMLPDLRILSEKLGLRDHIVWLGNVVDPRTLRQDADIFLLASVGETFGLVLAEAMACGVPVVGSRSGSISRG